jgi:hypothetical protein
MKSPLLLVLLQSYPSSLTLFEKLEKAEKDEGVEKIEGFRGFERS